jgi:hypothetical protein
MYPVSQKLRIAKSWLASFLRGEWRPEHYPIVVREQVEMPDEQRWHARVLNWPAPIGLGPTKQQARAALEADLHAIATKRQAEGKLMPRPGTRVPVQFASTARVGVDPALLIEFITKALGFGPDDPVFISDLSTISHFGDDERVREIRANIREHFGVTVDQEEPVLIADVLEAIRRRNQA